MELSVSGQRILPKSINKKNTAVIGISDLNRMKMQLVNGTKKSSKEEDRTKLKALSDARVKNWPNTVEALRQKKDNERYEKFKQDEVI